MTCEICRHPIADDESFVGAGDGRGHAFAHRRCWKIVTWAQHYGAKKSLAEIVKEAVGGEDEIERARRLT